MPPFTSSGACGSWADLSLVSAMIPHHDDEATNDGGIAVPELLQPLFNMEFVPFAKDDTTSTTLQRSSSITSSSINSSETSDNTHRKIQEHASTTVVNAQDGPGLDLARLRDSEKPELDSTVLVEESNDAPESLLCAAQAGNGTQHDCRINRKDMEQRVNTMERGFSQVVEELERLQTGLAQTLATARRHAENATRIRHDLTLIEEHHPQSATTKVEQSARDVPYANDQCEKPDPANDDDGLPAASADSQSHAVIETHCANDLYDEREPANEDDRLPTAPADKQSHTLQEVSAAGEQDKDLPSLVGIKVAGGKEEVTCPEDAPAPETAVSAPVPLQVSGEKPSLKDESRPAETARPSVPAVDLAEHQPALKKRRPASTCCFMRADNELNEDETESCSSVSLRSFASSSQSRQSANFLGIDDNLPSLLEKLNQIGWRVATDESDSFSPVRDAKRIQECLRRFSKENWPVSPWYVPPLNANFLWVQQKSKTNEKVFGHEWPVVKARGIVRATPRKLLDMLLDSSKFHLYNKISQGRFDLHVIQDDVDVTATESEYGFAGCAKIMRTLVKPRLLPKTMEVITLTHAQPLSHTKDAYIMVNRSVWEDRGAKSQNNNNLLRSEVLLSVQILRPVSAQNKQWCELTTVMHVCTPGIPQVMARRAAPNSAGNMMRDIQTVFA